jgi:4-amino-4-deoxy-L-arabinose transferase-like glycosyltransferase
MDPDLSLRRWDDEQVGWDQDRTVALAGFGETVGALAQPLIRPAPRSAMVFPLVVLVAVLPGMVALNSWDLTPPGPLWGLRGLAVLDGLVLDQMPAVAEIKPIPEAAAFKAVAFQPPLYAWLEALGLWLSTDRDPMASVLPSYMAGALMVVLVYLHGRLWRGAGLGLTAAILVGFNQSLLLRMQEATPTTLVVCGVLAALLAYGWHERMAGESARPWSWAGPTFWAVAGGMALGVALLSLGGLAFIAIPIVVLHQLYLSASSASSTRGSLTRFWWRGSRDNPGLVDGLLAICIALAVAMPWFILMVNAHGWQALAALGNPPDSSISDQQAGLLPRLIKLAPVTLPLGLFGAVRAIRSALIDESDTLETVGGSLWVIWLGVAALASAVWPGGPRSAFDLLLLVPLSLLAAQSVADLANRRISVRTLIVVAPATAVSITWWTSADLSQAVDDLIHGRADSATALGLHLALDLIVASVMIIRALNRWARRRDDRQRWILAVYLVVVMSVTVVIGLREVLFRHGETRALLSLRTMILRRNRDNPFQVVAVVGPSLSGPGRDGSGPFFDRPLRGGRLRFILRTALPRLPQRDLNVIDGVFTLPEGRRLIVLMGTGQRLSSAVQSKLGLEAIHPGRSGILDAYATARDPLLRR